MAAPNLCFNHLAICVPDLDAAVAWYRDLFGFAELRPPVVHDRAANPDSNIFAIYPESLQTARIAFLSAGNGVGIEVFEMRKKDVDRKDVDRGTDQRETKIDPERGFERDYARGGFFHVCVTTPDVPALVDRVCAAGGRQLGATVDAHGHSAAYVEDPWGSVFELLDCSFERLMANRV